MFIQGPSTHRSCEFVDISFMYVRRISSPGAARITGGSSCPSKEKAALPVSGSLIACRRKGERTSGGSDTREDWLTSVPGIVPCAYRCKPKSKPKGKLHLNKLLYLSWKNGFTFIFPQTP